MIQRRGFGIRAAGGWMPPPHFRPAPGHGWLIRGMVYVNEQGVVRSVSPGPGPLSEEGPWAVEAFPPGNEHGPFALLFAALGAHLMESR